MKRKIIIVFVLSVLIGTYHLMSPEKASADVSVHIGIGAPLPTVVVPAPPAVVVIPGTPVYYAPDVGIDLFFYSGRWYRKHDGHWYIATYYNGPWAYLPAARVPTVFVNLPGGSYNIPPGHQRIPYGQLKKHWKKWDKEHRKHWKHRHEDGDD